ncbi:MAG TPA: ubiquinone/menaquinone biosynthesis methyltransferase [Planctomycetota bacterium]|nr:ubiquinone/menaquinone biosynthesis methyltransferase [Planctomycetota bacterium]
MVAKSSGGRGCYSLPPSMPDPSQVRAMFARISGRYDLLNHLLSMGIDRSWRRKTVEAAGDVEGRVVVDACCGTGDLSAAFARRGARVIGVDFTPEMLSHAGAKLTRSKHPAIFAHGDALALPLRTACADVTSVAFGVRNLSDARAGLAEMARVTKPGGRVLVLEFTTPRGAVLGPAYRLYFTRLLPTFGRWISKDEEAYMYLPRTVSAWPSPEQFQRDLESVGLVECGFRTLTRGIACLHWGRVPKAC